MKAPVPCCHRADCRHIEPTGRPGVVNACTKTVMSAFEKIRRRDAELLRRLAR